MSSANTVTLDDLARVSASLSRLSEQVQVLAARLQQDRSTQGQNAQNAAQRHAESNAERPAIRVPHPELSGRHARPTHEHGNVHGHAQPEGSSPLSPVAAAHWRYISQNMPMLARGIIVEASSDEEPVLRPGIYPESHRPQPRLDALESHRWDRVEVLDALKLESFEGFYNLAMLILSFSMVYLVIRNFREKGNQMHLSDFTCPQLHRDIAWAGVVTVAMYLWSTVLYASVRLWIRKKLSWTATAYLYGCVQTFYLVGICAFLYATPMAPLPSAVLLMVGLVLSLKMHSYIATNYAMYNEHIAKYGRVLSDSEAPLSSSRGSSSKMLSRTASATKVTGAPAAEAPRPVAAGEDAKGVRKRKKRAKQDKAERPPRTDASDSFAHEGDPHGQHTTTDNDDEMDSGEDERLWRSGKATPPLGSPLRSEASMAGFDLAAAAAGAENTLLPSGEGAFSSTSMQPGGGAIISGSHAQKRRLIRAWPHNVTLRDFLYFLAAPTLVYEPKYPRTTRVRWKYVALKMGQMAACMALQYVVFRQFMLPVLMHPTKPMGAGPVHTVAALVFDMMKLAVPSLAVWLLGFYSLFHCFLNTLAEVLRFADREFYLSWWSATNIGSFWRTWNVPVHEWCLRHIFCELQHYLGVKKNVAVAFTFFFSAVFHEVIFSVAFKTLRPWFFFGMLLQIPLIIVGNSFKNRRRGNFLVWLSLFLGQPALELMYFREYFESHTSFFCTD